MSSIDDSPNREKPGSPSKPRAASYMPPHDHENHDMEGLSPTSVEALRTYQIELKLQNEELRRIEQELRLSRQEFFNFFMLSPVPYLVIDSDLTIVKSNYEADTLLFERKVRTDSDTLLTLCAPTSHEALLHALRPLRTKEMRISVDLLLQNGKRVECVMNPIPQGRFGKLQILCTLSDISESAREVDALQKEVAEKSSRVRVANSLLDGLVECMADTMLVLDRYGRILDARGGDRLRFLTIKSLSVGSFLSDVFDDTVAREIADIVLKSSWATEPQQKIIIPSRKDGLLCHLSLTCFHIGNKQVILIRVLSDINQVDDHDLKRDRLNLVGTMAAGLAHQFNNIHHPLLAHLQELESLLTSDEAKEHLSRARSLGEKAATLTRSILGFSGSRSDKFEVIRVKDIVDQVMLMVADSLTENGIEYHEQVGAGLCIKGDQSQLEQVLLNLLINASHAMLERPKKKISITASAKHETLELKVTDTGQGISSENLQRIFEPLFTTKGEFAPSSASAAAKVTGTGLGLSLCRQIINLHAGSIEVESTIGSGTTFTIRLPLSYGAPLADQVVIKPESDLRISIRGKHALVVDDSDAVRAITKLFLQRAGMQVTECENGVEALAAVANAKFDVILTDWRMPKMAGLEFVRILSERLSNPPPVIVVSAVSEQEAEELHEMGIVCGFLAKPFTEDALTACIEKALVQVQTWRN